MPRDLVRARVDVGQRDDVRGGHAVHRGGDRAGGSRRVGVEGRRVDGRPGPGAARARGRDPPRGRRGPAGRGGTRCRGPGAPTTWTAAGSSPIASTRRALASLADEVEVGELRDRVAQRRRRTRPSVCSPPWRWAIGTRSSVAASAAAAVSNRSPTSTSASGRASRRWAPTSREGVGGLVGGGRRSWPRASSRASAARPSGSKPSSRTQVDRVRRGAPRGACPRRRRPGAAEVSSRIATHVERRMPQSWRPVVRTAIDRTGSGVGHARLHEIVGLDHRAGARPRAPCGARRACRRRAGARPVPGRRATRSSSGHDRAPPAGSVRQWRLRRATRATSRSASTGTFTPVPIAASTARIAATMRREPGGLERRRVVGARPRPIQRQVLLDERGAGRDRGDARRSMPGVWSDQPTGTPNARRSVSIARRLASAGSRRVARHAVEQRERRVAVPRAIASTAAATSTMSAMPVESEQRAAAAREPGEERQVGQLARPDLERRHVEARRAGRPSRRRTASRGTRCRARGRGAGARPRPRRAGPAGRASRAGPQPDRRPAAGTRRSARRPTASASGSNVWNLTASAPASAAASIEPRARCAGSPSWLTPASAITNTGPRPISRSPIGTRTARAGAARTASAASEVVLLVDVDRPFRGELEADRPTRLDEPARPRELGGVDDVERARRGAGRRSPLPCSIRVAPRPRPTRDARRPGAWP